MDLAISIVGFRGKDWKFLPKEIAVISVTGNILGHWIIEAPYPFTDLPETIQAENNRRTRDYHKLDWFEGDSSAEAVYSNLLAIVKRANTIYTVTEEARFFLKKLLCRDITNLENRRNWISFVEIFPTKTTCVIHGLKHNIKDFYCVCAITTARQIKKWLLPLPPTVQQNEENAYIETEL